jgi:cytidylate kinase
VLRRVAITSSAPGSGKSTLAKEVARRLDLSLIDVDGLAYPFGFGAAQATAEDLRERIEPIVAQDRWVVDAIYRGKLGNVVPARADVLVWLDLPVHVWVPRLIRRDGFLPRLLLKALRGHFSRRRRYPLLFGEFPVVRLRTRRSVEDWLDEISTPVPRH